MTAPRPMYGVVRRNFYHPKFVKRPALFAEIGHPELARIPAWANTCAVRLSLALVKSGVVIPGRMIIRAGKYKGRRIEQNVARLARGLTDLFGPPEEWANGSDASAYIGTRRGIVAFYSLYGSAAEGDNHIDLVSPAEGLDKCANTCYWQASRFQFWPLPN